MDKQSIEKKNSQNVQERLTKLQELFPEAVKDGRVDYSALKEVIEKKEDDNRVEKEDHKISTSQKQFIQRAQRRKEREEREKKWKELKAEEEREAEELARLEQRRKIIAAVAAAIVTLLMIYWFGLLGPAVFGLIAGRILKG